jgi:hypothetical protein
MKKGNENIINKEEIHMKNIGISIHTKKKKKTCKKEKNLPVFVWIAVSLPAATNLKCCENSNKIIQNNSNPIVVGVDSENLTNPMMMLFFYFRCSL